MKDQGETLGDNSFCFESDSYKEMKGFIITEMSFKHRCFNVLNCDPANK